MMDVHHLRTLGCPGCGASLPVEGAASMLSCRFCGQAVPVPDDLPDEEAVDASVQDALERARRKVRSRLFGSTAMAFEPVGVILGIIVSILLGALLAVYGYETLGTIVGFVGFFVGGIPFILFFYAVDRRVSGWRARRVARRIELQQADAACTRCGAPVVVPGGTVQLDCAHCEARLLASDGLLVAWDEDLDAAVDALDARAAELEDKSGRIAVKVGYVVIFGFIAAAALGPMVYLIALAVMEAA